MAIEVLIRAKSEVSAALAKAGASIGKFKDRALKAGVAVGRAFAAIGKAAIGAGAAIAGAVAATVAAYQKQEQAEAALAASLRANGESVDVVLPKMKALAAAIQDQTGIADESTLAMMAQLNTLGVSSDKLEEATKMTLALTKAGAGQETALRAAAAAIGGNTTMLTRYIPALRSAETEAEKMAIVNDLSRRGFEQLQEELGTTGGQWRQLKGRIGDAMEEVGRAIVNSSGMESVLESIADKVKALTQRFSDWANDGGMDRLIASVKVFGVDFVSSLSTIKAVAEGAFDVIWTSANWAFQNTMDAGVNAVRAIQTAFGNMKDNVGKIFAAIWEKVKNPSKPFQAPDLTAVLDGFQAIETAAKKPSEAWKEAADEIKQIQKDAAGEIQQINSDLTESELARIAKQKAEMESAAKAEQEAAKETAEVVVDATEEKTDAAKAQLEEVKKIVAELGSTDLGNITEGKAKQFIRALEVIADSGVKIGDLGLDNIKGVDLGNITAGKARQFVRAMADLAKAQKIPDLGLKQFEVFGNLDAGKIKDMLDALKAANGAKIEFDFGKDVNAALKDIAKNTAATAANTNALPGLLQLK